MRVHLYRRGNNYWVDYRKNGKRVRESLGIQDKPTAELSRAELEVSILKEELGVISEQVPIDDFLDEYFDYQRSHRTHKGYQTDRGYLTRFIEETGLQTLEELQTQIVTRYLILRANRDQLVPKTLNRIRGVVMAMCSFAVDHGYMAENPVKNVRRWKEPEREIVFLTAQEIDELLKGLKGDPHLHGLTATLIFAGLRRSEACWLTWEDVDKGSRVLHIRSKTRGGVSWMPKTGRNRRVPVNTRLRPFLFDVKHKHRTWVHPSPLGCRWDPDNLTARFRAKMKKLKLPWRIMDLRHTFGSHLAQKGVSLFKIATLMGNSPPIVQKHYARLVPESMREEVEF